MKVTKRQLIGILVILGFVGLAVGIWFIFEKVIIGEGKSEQEKLLTCNNCQEKECKTELNKLNSLIIKDNTSNEDLLLSVQNYTNCVCTNCKDICTDLDQPGSIKSTDCDSIS